MARRCGSAWNARSATKSMKYLTELIVTEHIDDGGDRGYPKNGWAWYNGI
jgi:hypothetical protein